MRIIRTNSPVANQNSIILRAFDVSALDLNELDSKLQ